MIAGIVLSGTRELGSEIAFLGDEMETFSLESNEEIIQKLEQFEPEILAVDSAEQNTKEGLSENEEELREEGYSFTPSSAETKKVRRLQGLKKAIEHRMDQPPELIRFDPHITAEELAVDGDKALKSYGIDPSGIGSARQFDAVLGAITARFYQQGQFQDLGVIVPTGLEESED